MKVLVFGSLVHKEIYKKITETYPNANTPLQTFLFEGIIKKDTTMHLKRLKRQI